MQSRKLRLSILLLGWLLAAIAHAQDFSKIYVFGDSLSDRGNLAALSAAPGQEFLAFLTVYPFDQGFSNAKSLTEPGRRAVEVLADALALPIAPALHTVLLPQGLPSEGNNFAVAGAVASGLLANGGNDLPVFLLETQLAAFDLEVASASPAPDLANALFVVFIGGNDVRVARDADSPKLASRIVNTAVAKIDAAIRHVTRMGGRTFLVVNSPDIGAIPETRALAQKPGNRGAAARATRLTRRFNSKLAATLTRTRKTLGVQLVQFDLFHFFRDLLENAKSLGFDNTRDTCVDNPLLPAIPSVDPACLIDFDRFVFFDEVHPTNHVQQRVGRALYALVPALPAP